MGQITLEFFKEYTSLTEVPSNFNRLLFLSEELYKKYYRDDLSDECKDLLKKIICEQILFFMNSDIDTIYNIKSIRLGDAKEEYELKKESGYIMSPLCYAMLENSPCDFFYTKVCKGHDPCLGKLC